MNNTVMLKSFKNGINIKMDPEADFETISAELVEKLSSSAKFFGNARLVVSFEGRELSQDEEDFLVQCICDNTDIIITCIVGKNEAQEIMYVKAANSSLGSEGDHHWHFYKGSVKAGETLETDSSLIILGDVNVSANVNASGNIIVLGTIYGHVHAGCFGDDKCFIVVLDLKPTRIRIANHSEVLTEKNGLFLKNKTTPKLIFIRDGNMIARAVKTETIEKLPI